MGRPGNAMLKNGWKPAYAGLGGRGTFRPMMGAVMDKEGRQEMGLAILAALSISGLHAAICPSWFTMASFASQPEAQARAMKGLWISLGASTLASVGLYFVFDKWLPAIVGEATALALFGIGVWAINSKPPETIPPIEKQEETTSRSIPVTQVAI